MKQFNYANYQIQAHIDVDTAKKYIDFLINKQYTVIKSYKNNDNSFTARIKIDGDDNIILKIPKGRNKRVWQKVLSILRDSDAFRIQNSLVKLLELGLNGPCPILAAQQKGIAVKESFFLYRYQEGVEATKDDYELVATELLKLHGAGYLRGDCKASNFLIHNNQAYFIDFRLKRPLLFQKTKLMMEYVNLCRTMPKAFEVLPKQTRESLHFKLVLFLVNMKIYIRQIKKSLKF